MPSYRTLRVAEVLKARAGIQRVRLDDGSLAYVLTQLIGDVHVGDEVVVNTTAVDLGLGTGGWHVVHWNLARRELSEPGPGHIMKLRYTSLQVDSGAAEETDQLNAALPAGRLPDLRGVPVLVGSLHSQLAVAAAVVKALRPALRVTYVMTDGASLPMALSDSVAALRALGLLDATITAGHAFGGDLEAVSVPSALQLAVEVQRADIVICVMGPGAVGTNTALGNSAVEVAAILTIAHQLGARPVVMARASGADPRTRHRGISHHTSTALALTPVAAVVPLPRGCGLGHAIAPPHEVVEIDPPDVVAILGDAGLTVTTMGRGPNDDRLFFEVVAGAAAHAVNLAPGNGTVMPS